MTSPLTLLPPLVSISPTQAKTFLGTQAYMSPERLQGEPYDISSDLWSLGLTLVEAATGKWPFPECSDKLIEFMMQVRVMGQGCGKCVRRVWEMREAAV